MIDKIGFLIPLAGLLMLSPLYCNANTGQTDSIAKPPQPRENKWDISGIVPMIEQRHGASIYYKKEWFDQQTYDPALLELPLPQLLSELVRGQGLSILTLDGMIFLIPSEQQPTIRQLSSDDLIIIGNPNEFGRYSRASLSGVIRDGTSGEPLFGAVLFDPVSGQGATTDMDGAFTMELPAGDHRLRVSYVGYEELHQRIRLISDGELELSLFSGSTLLQEFVVTALRAEENIARTQMSLINLDSRAIQELPGSFGERDIVRSITLLPGIQTVGEFGTGFNVRGGSADQNLILMEHVPLFNSSHLFGLISVVNPDLVNNVTLIKAGTPARYGERASSVMDIRLGNGLNQEETTVKGSLGVLNSRLLLESPVVKDIASIAVGGRVSNSDWYLRRMPSEDLMNSAAGFRDLTALAHIALTTNNRVALFGYHSFDTFSFGGETGYEYTNSLASLRWNSVFGPNLTSAFVVGISEYDFQVREEPGMNPSIHFLLNSSLSYESLRWVLSWIPTPSHNIEFGINAIRYGIQPGALEPLGRFSEMAPKTIEKEQGVELAGFVSNDFSISEKLSMEMGLRFTQYLQYGPATVHIYEEGVPKTPDNLTDSVHYREGEIASRYNGLEPRMGLRFRTGESSSLKLSYARINQYINLVSNTAIMGPADLWKLSDTHIKPLQSDQYAIGYFRNFWENALEFSAEAYYKKLHNAIEYKSGAEVAMNEYLETDIINAEGYNVGVEVYLKKNSGRLTGWTSYTFSSSMRRSQSRHPESQINGNAWFPSNYDRPHNLVLNSSYHISRRWRFGATFTYNTGRPVTLPEVAFRQGEDYLVYYSDRNKYRLPDYHRLDLSISLGENLKLDKRGKGSFTFSVMNVYGRKNPHSIFYKRDPSGRGKERSFKLFQLYIISRPIPTITYNFSF
ncbi:MAG: TonB-dependent receptor [Bacteroidales bacterium]